ncbi:MAG: hypothetical protein EOP56_13350 [Sphingobacteriales bacterium]|nr:MAG: hypothetical protein EOP56_13350 [Sphingobacteriales bacterium]
MSYAIVDAKLPKDTSTIQSLFSGTFSDITSLEITLEDDATGTANFAIYENGKEVASARVTGGQSLQWSPQESSVVKYYVNYYDGDDLAEAKAIATNM